MQPSLLHSMARALSLPFEAGARWGSALRFTMNHYSPILKYQPYVGIGQVIGYNVGPQGDKVGL